MIDFIWFVFFVLISLTKGQLNETIIRQIRPLSSSFFDEIIVDGSFDVFLKQSNRIPLPSVELETAVYVHEHLTVEILDDHILYIHLTSQLVLHKNINAHIHFNPPLRRYTIKGTGNTMTDENGLVNEGDEKFILDNRGTANVAMQLNVNDFEIYLSGTGNSRFWGQVRNNLYLETKGVGDINAMNLMAKKADVYSAGVSTVRVAATEDIRVEVTGVSTVYYRLLSGKKPSKTITTGLGQIIPVS